MLPADNISYSAMAGEHPPIAHGNIGVLLVNLGTPEAPTRRAVRAYLKEFLSDKRVIEMSPLLWQMILRLFILPLRAQKSANAYASVWDTEADISPLKRITGSQAEALAEIFNTEKTLLFDWAMRYGRPSVGDKIDALMARGCDRILVCPLYPQYAAATMGSAQDAVFAKLRQLRWVPQTRFLAPYYDADSYIAALAASIKRHAPFDTAEMSPHHALLMSFHGLPERSLRLGDPYYCHCHKTARLLREALGFSEEQSYMAFQSRFGRLPWLKPYADRLIAELPAKGVTQLAVVCPGFAADCLETLEEVAIGFREQFLVAGGKQFTYIPCLNDSMEGLSMLTSLIKTELRGWLEI